MLADIDCGMPPALYPDGNAYYSERANTSQILNTTYGAQYPYTCSSGYFVDDAQRGTDLLLECGDLATWRDVDDRTCIGRYYFSIMCRKTFTEKFSIIHHETFLSMYVHVHVVHILIRHLLKQILYYVFLHVVVLDRRDLRVATYI